MDNEEDDEPCSLEPGVCGCDLRLVAWTEFLPVAEEGGSGGWSDDDGDPFIMGREDALLLPVVTR